MDWFAEIEFRAELTEKQLDELAAGVRAAYYNSADHVLRLQEALDEPEYGMALDAARRWVDVAAVDVVRACPAAEVLRVVVESGTARRGRWAVGAKEAAELLGVSTARVRQLRGSPGFPAPVAETAGGEVYRADEVESYGRVPRTQKGGRPRKEP